MSLPAPSTPAGNNFQHYEILRREDGSPWELGRGTMGITYKAFDVNLCCEVALKVVNAVLLDNARARERFVREAKAAASLRHRNVASVYHLGNDGERFFYAMEFIDGETLDALVRREGPLPVDLALRLLLQTARALAAAGRQNLVHRDIKPANLMVTREDADDHLIVKVIDFGLARPVAGKSGGSSGQLTGGGFVGTPQFASPERLEEKPLDARSDIYSLGVTAWFLLTGSVPFVGSLATICHQHLQAPPPWDQLPGWLPEPVRTLLAHTLEKDPARRPQDAVELRRGIEDCVASVKALAANEMAPRPWTEIAVDSDGAGSIVDRLSLVSGEPTPVGRWLFGMLASAVVFVAVVAGVWVVLAQRLPARAAVMTPTPAVKPSPTLQHRHVVTPHPAVPPPLPKEKEITPTPAPTPAHAEHPQREVPMAPAIPVAPSPSPSPEPEIRRALPPLTPFDPDATPTPHGSPG